MESDPNAIKEDREREDEGEGDLPAYPSSESAKEIQVHVPRVSWVSTHGWLNIASVGVREREREREGGREREPYICMEAPTLIP